ncbi:MAG TPA: DNA-processing protein DprA [Candidatus Paceibacterota bacterium]|jgi:DNA processing protein|nr:DNA-processing protein DprA [Candidatus Paceibacterota bacterium]
MERGLKLLLPERFPPLLREIPDAPKRLYVRGELPSFEKKWLAVVGSRAMTSYGRQACEHLISGLVGYPVVIVSGLAFGVDAHAHRVALDVGLPTVSVLGSGLEWDVLYPRSHLKLGKEILEKGGALLSEEKPEAKSMEHMYPKRNRIMAGMCHATLVVEAKEKSGSLITAKFAADYNRDLLVVPGSIFSAESKGAHQFLRLGATAATSPQDVLRALGITPAAKNASERNDLSGDELRVVELIAAPLPRDELIRALLLSAAEANILLSTMELKGVIVEELGVVRAR